VAVPFSSESLYMLGRPGREAQQHAGWGWVRVCYVYCARARGRSRSLERGGEAVPPLLLIPSVLCPLCSSPQILRN
jgi:hypothetical protein